MLRSRKTSSAERRLRKQLFYYFENDYDELFGKRLFMIDGDITHEIQPLDISTVINCVAVVKHFSEGTELEAIADKGLNAKIMRVGTLSARYSDGEFQINSNTNSSMGRLKIYAMLGLCPYEQLDVPMEFSPIYETAKAILRLCETPR